MIGGHLQLLKAADVDRGEKGRVASAFPNRALTVIFQMEAAKTSSASNRERNSRMFDLMRLWDVTARNT
jgi:hypothetical protein